MFSRKSKAQKEQERRQRQEEEIERQREELTDKAMRNRQKIIAKHRDRLIPEIEDKEIIAFSYSKNESVVVAVYPDRIRLRSFRKGLMATGLRGEKTIYLNRITSVQMKEPGITAGYIQFKTGSEGESRSSTFNAVSDENAVTFTQDQEIEFNRIRDIVERQIQHLHSGTRPSVQSSLADELTKLAALRDQGVLADEEFEVQKRRLLG